MRRKESIFSKKRLKTVKTKTLAAALAVLVACAQPVSVLASESTTDTSTESTTDSSVSGVSTIDKDGDGVPDLMDFKNDTDLQDDAWSVMLGTDWTSKEINLNFLLGEDGIAFAANVDQFADFKEVFENPLVAVMEELDDDAAAGKRLVRTNPHYNYQAYTKIVAVILYNMLIGGNDAVVGSWVTFAPSTDSTISIFKNSFSKDNALFIEPSKTLVLSDSFKNWCLSNDYKEAALDRALWTELAKMYFGKTCVSFKDFVAIIIERITRFDGKATYACPPDVEITYFFNVYKNRDMYNYVVLDSLMDADTTGFNLTKSFFYTFLYSNEDYVDNGYGTYYEALRAEWDENYYDDGYLAQCNDWGKTTTDGDYVLNFRNVYYYNYAEDDIPFFKYHREGDNSYVSYDGWEISNNRLPGGFGNDIFGQGYYNNYVAIEIKNHTINGATGEVIDETK